MTMPLPINQHTNSGKTMSIFELSRKIGKYLHKIQSEGYSGSAFILSLQYSCGASFCLEK